MRQVAVRLPEWDEPLLRLAESKRASGESHNAEEAYRQVLDLNPERQEASIALAGLLLLRGNAEEARDLLTRCCDATPDNAEAWNALGIALRVTNAPDQALSAFQTAQKLEPSCSDYFLNGVEAAVTANQGDAELGRLTKACEQYPLNPAIQLGRGMLLEHLGSRAAAIDALEVATELTPDATTPLRLLGGVLARSSRVREAEKTLRRVSKLEPDNPQVHNDHAAVLMRLHQHAEAREILLAILDRHGPHTAVMCNLANATVCVGFQDEAVEIARKAISLDPGAVLPRRALCNTLPYRDGITGAELLAAMRDCSAVLPRSEQPPFVVDTDPNRPLVVGLLSGTLRSHPVGWLTVAGIESLDPDQFSVVCLAQNTALEDPIARRYRTIARDWIEVDGLNDARLTALAREQGIDILIDLGGYGCMPDGYVCYSPPPHAPDVVALPALENGFVTFGCYNNLAKMTPRVIETWAAILKRLPTARLVMKTHQLSHVETANRFRSNFAALGIEDARISFQGSSGHRAFMGEYGKIDIILDPFPYSGGLTTCEALWMGVPTITFPGEIFASRHSASHMSNVGLDDWVTPSTDAYMDLAVARASDLAALAELRHGLREKTRKSPLCDAPRFGRNLGTALRHAWQTFCAENKANDPRR